MTEATPYRVLARKYRPATFAELIGQEAMVQTLSNAIAAGRIAQAFVLTGVRGVGKTTTARIIARALNCVGPDGKGGPTIEPCGVCPNCIAIAEDRHQDVLEMDAASRTGIGDIREITEAVRYAPSSARYKVYIIDEVHMLSTQAFNGLLKTLEEPPPHVKFIFATTEIRKVPVTVLSRCQRFDLRRVEAATLIAHFEKIAKLEKAKVAPEALALIARAAEGSVRDGLSLLDQAIAHGNGEASADQVRDMLGLADRAQVFDLMEHTLSGDLPGALASLRNQYDSGADPVVVLQDMLELTHWLTRIKVTPEVANDVTMAESERSRGKAMADKLGMPVLARVWQMLLKGLGEARAAPLPLAAVEMVLVRLAYAADLPAPADLIKELQGGARPSAPLPSPPPSGGNGGGQRASQGGSTNATATARLPQEAPETAPAMVLPDFVAVVKLFGDRNEAKLKAFFYNDAHLVRFEPNRIELRLNPAVPANFSGEVMQRLRDWTGERWTIVVSKSEGAPTLAEQEKVARADSKNRAADHPLVKAALAAFPGAELVKVQPLHVPAPVAVPDLPATDPDRASADLDYNEGAAADFMESFDA